ncbi:MAG: LysM peptidoglycan-binding domain-containing protein [Verrucomicrobiae bacterium]|nr:LysM peptidoglycan-binding domain-containing protein [Verrucomicrobiae bacterium]
MQNSNEIPTRSENGSPPADKGRAWRIVIIVLALHAALLGSVVLIQGCGSKDVGTMGKNEGQEPVKQAEEQVVASADTNSVNSTGIICPSASILTPEEQLNKETAALGTTTPGIPGAEDQTASQTDPSVASSTFATAPKSETPKVETAKPEKAVETAQAAKTASSTARYTVARGDTLGKVAKKYGVSVSKLASMNKMTAKSALKAGQKLVVPAPASAKKEQQLAVADSAAPARKEAVRAVKTAPAKPVTAKVSTPPGQTHVVKAGESLYSIAKRYNVSVQSLKQANRIADESKIRVSQKLVVPVGSVKTTAEAPVVKTAADTRTSVTSSKTMVKKTRKVRSVIVPEKSEPASVKPAPVLYPAVTEESMTAGEEVEGT